MSRKSKETRRLVSGGLVALFSPFILFSGFWGTAVMACEPADLVLHNTKVYTVDTLQPTASAVAIKGDTFVYVGDEHGVQSYMCGGAEVHDMAGSYIFPGFTDSHVHLKKTGYREKSLNLASATSKEAMLQQVADFAEAERYGLAREWVQGTGWIEKVWPDKRFPTVQELDAIVPDRPVFLVRADFHSAVVNSMALSIIGVDDTTPDPAGGVIERDAYGKATGLLVDTAMQLVGKHLPQKSRAEDKQALLWGLERNVRFGWTQTQEAGGHGHDMELLQELKQENKLLHRVYVAVGRDKAIKDIFSTGRSLDDRHMFEVRGIKLMVDGALGSRGAALLEPYSDAAHTSGLMLTDRETILPILKTALRKGIQVETHAIGDKANKLVLDWYAEAMAAIPREQRLQPEPRWRIEHAQNVQPEDQIRFRELGLIASMQPSHAIGDLYFAGERLGKDRLKNAYVWSNFIELGVPIAGGSDVPVEAGDPRIEFYAAISRRAPDGYYDAGWHIEQAVSREDALRMFTIWPAYAAFQEDVRGNIVVGKLADLTIFNADLMHVPPEEILTSQVVMTVVGGDIVFKENQQ